MKKKNEKIDESIVRVKQNFSCFMFFGSSLAFYSLSTASFFCLCASILFVLFPLSITIGLGIFFCITGLLFVSLGIFCTFKFFSLLMNRGARIYQAKIKNITSPYENITAELNKLKDSISRKIGVFEDYDSDEDSDSDYFGDHSGIINLLKNYCDKLNEAINKIAKDESESQRNSFIEEASRFYPNAIIYNELTEDILNLKKEVAEHQEFIKTNLSSLLQYRRGGYEVAANIHVVLDSMVESTETENNPLMIRNPSAD